MLYAQRMLISASILEEVNPLPLFPAAQKTTARPGAGDAFDAQFYAPYAAAAQSALALVCAARSRMDDPAAVLALTYRLKTPASIRGKLAKLSLAATPPMAAAALHDIAGIRVVLKSEDAVYAFAALLRDATGAQVLAERDYIAAPKQSGYRSLHLILLPRGTSVPAEIQLRTPQMDVWAAAKHDLIYKPVQSPESSSTSPR